MVPEQGVRTVGAAFVPTDEAEPRRERPLFLLEPPERQCSRPWVLSQKHAEERAQPDGARTP